jgi:NDP-hexose 4-ketoreductase
VIIEGRGLLAGAFGRHGDPSLPALVFARGVSDSTTTDEGAYVRELDLLAASLATARREGIPLVYLSGAPVYGAFLGRVREEGPVAPTTRYGRHQLACEELIRGSGADHVILRLPNAVGPGGNPHQLVPSLVRQVRAGHVLVYDGAGRDLVDVRDVVVIAERLLRAGVMGVTVNCASGITTPVVEIVDAIAEILGAHPEIERVAGGTFQRFDIGRLEELAAPLPFDGGYPVRVLARYVPTIADTADGAR